MSGKLITGDTREPHPEGLKTHFSMLLMQMNAPQAFIKNWHWIAAVDAYDTGDPKPLAALLREDIELPENVRAVLANIVKGKRKPNPKARYKIKGTRRLRAGLMLLEAYITRQELLDNAEYHAESKRPHQDPIDVIEYANTSYAKETAELLGKYKISKSTIDGLRKMLKAKIKKWPTL